MALMDLALRTYFRFRQQRIEAVLADPMRYQHKILKRLLQSNRGCAYGKAYDFGSVKDYNDYKKALPLVVYEDVFPQIERMIDKEPNVLVSAPVNWFAKSSGTTNDRSKYIPVTKNYLINGHLKCTWTTASIIYNEDPTAKLFEDKNLIMGGSLDRQSNGVTIGDISAIMLHHFPKIGRRFATPDFDTALIANWDEKIKKIAAICAHEKVTLMGGVPTWTMVLIKEILSQTGAANLSEVWPDLKSYLHGGIGFEPYREAFKKYIPSDKVVYREVYNASEGYFGIQSHKDEEGVALLCDHEIFYEFIAHAQYEQDNQEILLLDEVDVGIDYVIVISNTSGLYRYVIGDVIQFVSIRPYKLKVVGRTQQHINVFGEELMVSNTDSALAEVCKRHGAEVHEYTVAPIYMDSQNAGGHEWVIEFKKEPSSLSDFARDLDSKLRQLNSDYDAKRFRDMAMRPLVIRPVSRGTIEQWQRKHNKYGNQYKFPRLQNNRDLVESLVSS